MVTRVEKKMQGGGDEDNLFLCKAWRTCQYDPVMFLKCLAVFGGQKDDARHFTAEVARILSQKPKMHQACITFIWFRVMINAIKDNKIDTVMEGSAILKATLGPRYALLTAGQVYKVCETMLNASGEDASAD